MSSKQSKVLDKLTVSQLLVRKFPTWHQTNVQYCDHNRPFVPLLSHINQSTTFPIYFKVHFNINLSPMIKSSKWVFPSVFPTKSPMHFSPQSCVLMPRQSHSLICSPKYYLKSSTNQDDPHYAILSRFLLFQALQPKYPRQIPKV